jgi:hypothetical protein
MRPDLTSGIVPKRSADFSSHPTLPSVEGVIRGFLIDAAALGTAVSLTLRGDAERGIPMGVIEGVVREVRTLPDGRERVVIGLSEDADHVVPLDRIARVMAVPE